MFGQLKLQKKPSNKHVLGVREVFKADQDLAIYIYFYYLQYPLTVHFPSMHSMRYQPIFHTLYFTLHCACIMNNVVLTTVIEMIEILDGRVGKRSVERVRYVINNLLHFVIVKDGLISLVVCICTRLGLVKILPLLVK